MDPYMGRTHQEITEITRADNFNAALVAHLNSDEPHFYFEDKYISNREINEKTAALVANGTLVEIPGDPYTWELASEPNNR